MVPIQMLSRARPIVSHAIGDVAHAKVLANQETPTISKFIENRDFIGALTLIEVFYSLSYFDCLINIPWNYSTKNSMAMGHRKPICGSLTAYFMVASTRKPLPSTSKRKTTFTQLLATFTWACTNKPKRQ